MRILFMGTPDFASASLTALLQAHLEVVGVVTKPDNLHGRGGKIIESDVKKTAKAASLPVFQPETLKNEAFLPVLQDLRPDVITVVAYGKILPRYILDFPHLGCVNVHGSLLPEYRGAAPIQRTVLDGRSRGGVTTMLMDEGLDTGDLLLTEAVDVGENMTTGELFDTLAAIGGRLLVETVKALENGAVEPKKQTGEATYAAKITPEECVVDFARDAWSVHNTVRGLDPFPSAESTLEGRKIKLYGAVKCDEDGGNALPGTVLAADKTGVVIKCGRGCVKITRFKPEGKGVMTAADLVNGRKIAVGMTFGK